MSILSIFLPSECYLRTVETLKIIGYGMFTASMGIALPGIVNMTAVSVCIRRGNQAGLQFIVGAALATALQVALSLFFADVLQRHSDWLHFMQQAGIWVFLLLSLGFFWQARRARVARAAKSSGRKIISFGFGLSLANMLAVPYFLGICSWLVATAQIGQGHSVVLLFGLGALIGAFGWFLAYVLSASWITRHAEWLTRNLMYVMSAFCLFLAMLQLYWLNAQG